MSVRQIIDEALGEINLRLPREQRLANAPTTVLVGDGSSLDSAALLDFLLILEQKIEEKSGRRVSLVTDTDFDPSLGPLRTVGILESYLESVLLGNSR